jgi:hypothetical protein
MKIMTQNSQLEIDELRQQIRYMHEMGLGGFFILSAWLNAAVTMTL